MAKRADKYNLADEMLNVINELSKDGEVVTPSNLHEGLVHKSWDVDFNDCNQTIGRLWTEGMLYITFKRVIVLTPAGKERVEQLSIADNEG